MTAMTIFCFVIKILVKQKVLQVNRVVVKRQMRDTVQLSTQSALYFRFRHGCARAVRRRFLRRNRIRSSGNGCASFRALSWLQGNVEYKTTGLSSTSQRFFSHLIRIYGTLKIYFLEQTVSFFNYKLFPVDVMKS